jgi:hypothetical protein
VTPDKDPALLSGFRGNVISGLFGGVLFLLFGFYLNHELEKLQIETHTLTVERAIRDEEQRKIERFMAFLRTEQYHDVRFPNLKTPTEPLGLVYTVEPVRDENGEPKRHVSEMDVSYVVKVRCVAQEEERTSENLADYDNAAIHTGEFCFCRFYNGEWHMGRDVLGFTEWHSFYLSGKVGPIQHGMSANDFVGASAPPENAERVCRFLVKDDGTRMSGSGGATPVEIFRTKGGELLIQFYGAPPKYLRRERDSNGNTERLVILTDPPIPTVMGWGIL